MKFLIIPCKLDIDLQLRFKFTAYKINVKCNLR